MNRILTLALVIAMGASSAYAKNCKDPATGKFTKCPPAASAMASPKPDKPTESMGTAGAPNCKKGKPCGKSCIAKDKVCHMK